MAKTKLCIGCMNRTISVQRRSLVSSNTDSAEPTFDYATVFSTRAEIKTSGQTEWSKINIGGEAVTHTITIRHTALAFDTRDRVRDQAGNLYTIKSVDNVDEQDDWLRLRCVKVGHEDKQAVR